MNQNRNQNRRRGRGGNRGQSGGGQGNRIDSRARGNAPQMLEKYKKLAHDASLNGDRVQTEYYLQFADHYFRVVADSRVQRDDPRPRREFERDGDREPSYDDADEFEAADEVTRQPQRESRERDEEPADEGERGSEGDEAGEAERNPFVRENRNPRPRSRGRNRPANDAAESDAAASDEAQEAGFDAAVLPPSIARDEDAPRPRTRTRRSRPADDGDDEALEAVS